MGTMGSNKILFSYDFSPVGQGLFSTGYLWKLGTLRPRFHWVYDCGTSSEKKLVTASLSRYIASLGIESQTPQKIKPKIGMVVISHFDKDHISGIVSLLSKSLVHTLVLPYVPLWQRLCIAFSEGIRATEDVMGFYLDPVAYLLRRRRITVAQALLVSRGSSEVSSETTPTSPPTDATDENGGDYELQIFEPPPNNDIVDESEQIDRSGLEESGRKYKTAVRFLRPGTVMAVGRMWEFIPYNDSEYLPKTHQKFRDEVCNARETLLSNPTDNALYALRGLYEDLYGDSPENRNIISLFLYGGLLSEPMDGFSVAEEFKLNSLPNGRESLAFAQTIDPRHSVLYTGDGYLNDANRIKSLFDHMGSRRIKTLLCFQVMHHGSAVNCTENLAASVAPSFSVFSSDPSNRKCKHPNAEVLRYFHEYRPMFANKERGVSFTGLY